MGGGIASAGLLGGGGEVDRVRIGRGQVVRAAGGGGGGDMTAARCRRMGCNRLTGGVVVLVMTVAAAAAAAAATTVRGGGGCRHGCTAVSLIDVHEGHRRSPSWSWCWRCLLSTDRSA